MLSFTSYRIGCNLRSLPCDLDSLAPVPVSRLMFMSPFIQYFCHGEYDHPPINTSTWCLEGAANKMLHLSSPPSEEIVTPSIWLLRPKSCHPAYLPFSHISVSNPSISPSKNLVTLLPPHSTLHLFPGLQDGLQTTAVCLFPESSQNNPSNLQVKLSHSFVEMVFHLTL